jgi:hypothetical protein
MIRSMRPGYHAYRLGWRPIPRTAARSVSSASSFPLVSGVSHREAARSRAWIHRGAETASAMAWC